MFLFEENKYERYRIIIPHIQSLLFFENLLDLLVIEIFPSLVINILTHLLLFLKFCKVQLHIFFAVSHALQNGDVALQPLIASDLRLFYHFRGYCFRFRFLAGSLFGLGLLLGLDYLFLLRDVEGCASREPRKRSSNNIALHYIIRLFLLILGNICNSESMV